MDSEKEANYQAYCKAVGELLNNIFHPEFDYLELFQSVGDHEFLGYGFRSLGDIYMHRGELRKAAKAYSLSLQHDDVNYELKGWLRCIRCRDESEESIFYALVRL